MACFILASRRDLDPYEQDSHTCEKVSCILLDAVLLPITSIVVGVVGTILLLIKTLFRALTFILSRIANACQGTTPPTASRWFACISDPNRKPYAAPLLLLPVIGTAIYCSLFVKAFVETERDDVSCADKCVVALGAPWDQLKFMLTRW